MKAERTFIDPDWAAWFAHNGLKTFEDFWSATGTDVDPPNRARGGRSWVTRLTLSTPAGETRPVYLKRQENFRSRTAAHPWRGLLLAEREFAALQEFARRSIAAPHPVYFATRRAAKDRRAVLVTEELKDSRSLDDLRAGNSGSGRACERKAIPGVAKLLRAIHRQGWRHNCFYPKHVFVRSGADGAALEFCVIDLEKVRWRPPGLFGVTPDLRTFLNRCAHWSRTDRLRFIDAYLGPQKSHVRRRRLWGAIHAEEVWRSRPSRAGLNYVLCLFTPL